MPDRFALAARGIGAAALLAGLVTVAAPRASASPLHHEKSGHPKPAPRSGCACSLPASFAYSEFTPGSVDEVHGDSDGPTAFGGTSTLGNFAISTDPWLLPPFRVAFVAGGPVNGGGTTAIHYGNGYYDAGLSGIFDHDGKLQASSVAHLPVQFSQDATADAAFSAKLAALTTTPGDQAARTSTTLTLSATAPARDKVYVWDLTPTELSGITALELTGVPVHATVIVNVTAAGSVALSVGSVSLDGQSASTTTAPGPALADSTIWNFPSATALSLTGSWAGTVFAPGAATTYNHGHLWGTIEAASLTGTNESTYGPLLRPFCVPAEGSGSTSPGAQLPEGHPVEMVGSGVVLFGGFALLRRRRNQRRAAA